MPRRKTTEADYQSRILQAQKLLEARLDAPLDPALLARAAHFSLHHFHRIFRAQTGESVMQQVRRLRLERAARKLRLENGRLLEIAREAGYESHEAFTRAFSERFGLAPSLFRSEPNARLVEWQKPHAPPLHVQVHVQEFPALRVAALRSRGSYSKVGEAWQKMLGWANRHGLLQAGAELYGICPDDPDVTPEEYLRFDCCVKTTEVVTDPEVSASTIAAGKYAVGLHIGPYDKLHETYLAVIGKWFPQSGYELAIDPVVEHYLNDPACTPSHELQTQVRVRIADGDEP